MGLNYYKQRNILAFPKYRENPSLRQIKGIASRNVIKRWPVETFINDNGEEVHFQKLGDRVLVNFDVHPFIKIYRDAIPMISMLSDAAIKVLMYVIGNISPKKDSIIIDKNACAAACGYKTIAQVNKGVHELLEKRFIYRKEGELPEFFININYIYNGKRSIAA